MERAISCEFNLDTACVELKFADGSMISIDTVAVENEVADNMYQRSELDWLIAFCGAQRTPMRFRADAVRSITDALNRLL